MKLKFIGFIQQINKPLALSYELSGQKVCNLIAAPNLSSLYFKSFILINVCIMTNHFTSFL